MVGKEPIFQSLERSHCSRQEQNCSGRKKYKNKKLQFSQNGNIEVASSSSHILLPLFA